MVDVLKILVLLQRNARGPRQNKYNSNESDKIYPLTVKEIVEAQKADTKLKTSLKAMLFWIKD